MEALPRTEATEAVVADTEEETITVKGGAAAMEVVEEIERTEVARKVANSEVRHKTISLGKSQGTMLVGMAILGHLALVGSRTGE